MWFCPSALLGPFLFFSFVLPESRAHPHLEEFHRMHELHVHHFFRLKSLVMGVFGITCVVVLGYFVYQFFLQKYRAQRNIYFGNGAAFTERRTLLPHDYEREQTLLFQPVIGRIKSLKDYVGGIWATPTLHSYATPNPTGTPYRSSGPWEQL